MHRDANDLARAAIERLRGMNEASPHPQEAARVPEPPRNTSAPPADAPRVGSAPPVRPLPPPVMVSSPAGETLDSMTGSVPAKPSVAAAADGDDPRRLTPPADIPYARPLDLRADAEDRPRADHGCRRYVVGGEIGVSRGPAAKG